MKIFLGGTCNESTWRDELKPLLEAEGIEYFDPIVKDWDEAAQERERVERTTCDICLYTITPKMTGVYSIAEVVDDSNKRPTQTILVVQSKDGELEFESHALRSMEQVSQMVARNGGKVLFDKESLVKYLNTL